MNIDIETNYGSDKPERVYNKGKHISWLYPSLASIAAKPPPPLNKVVVPYLRLVTTRNKT